MFVLPPCAVNVSVDEVMFPRHETYVQRLRMTFGGVLPMDWGPPVYGEGSARAPGNSPTTIDEPLEQVYFIKHAGDGNPVHRWGTFVILKHHSCFYWVHTLPRMGFRIGEIQV